MSAIIKVNQPFILFTVGLPCAGKSTFITSELIPYMAEHSLYADILSYDDIIQHVSNVTRKSYNEVYKDIIQEAQSVIDDRIALSSYMKMNIIVDQYNLTKRVRKYKIA